MGDNTKIEWADKTFNPWTGCTKVSAACDFCYAEGWAKRSGHVEWGPHGARRRTKTWGNPVKWNNQARMEGTRYRVFCASLADVFDNHKSILLEWRDDLWKMIEDTPHLDWLLLTKRPQNVLKLAPWRSGYWPDNVWIGTTVENQEEADRRVPVLCQIPARVRFLSCEPLLGKIDLRWLHAIGRADGVFDALSGRHWEGVLPPYGETFKPERQGHEDREMRRCFTGSVWPRINWVITGGESGPNYRPANPDWFRSLRDQCTDADVPFLFKQWEGKTQAQIKAMGRELDGVVHDGYPKALITEGAE